ncbi:hypothetical protein D3C71_1443660 [compost metagenome]
MSSNYSYGKVTASNGVVLYFMKGSPRNISLAEINSNITASSNPDYGINGGFFYNEDLLSIAVDSDLPVKGTIGGYGSGWFNTKYDRGTLVWDNYSSAYSVQVVGSATDITVSNRNDYWAQGGISMSLNNDAGWETQASLEGMPNRTGLTMRTGLVYNSGLNIWMVVTKNLCTAAQFRTAIKEKIGSGTLINGIFLDGSGSSQMKCSEISLSGDGRMVRQIIKWTNK